MGVAALAAACGDAPPAGLALLEVRAPEALNGAIVVRFDGELDPLGASTRAIAVRDDAGRPLPVECAVRGAELRVALVVDAGLREAPPARVELQLAGLPSPHALAARDGRRLPAAFRRSLSLPPHLAAGADPVRLVLVDGRPVDGAPLPLGDELHLTFDGVLDPATLQPSAVPLEPVLADDVVLSPVAPALHWLIVGGRTELRLQSPPGSQQLRLHTRSLGVRGVSGGAVEPLVVLAWERR